MRAESGFLKGLNPTMAAWARFAVVASVIFGAVRTEVAGGA